MTDSIPKALAPLHGIPMLKRQISSLHELGVQEIVVLTGHRADMIDSYLAGLTLAQGLRVSCISTPSHFSPAQRLIEARSQIGNDFVLLYCDNFVYDSTAIQQVIESESPLTFLVQPRNEGNVFIHPFVRYVTERSPSTPFVELGYIHVKTPEFFKALVQCGSLPSALKMLTEELACDAVVMQGKADSTSTIERFVESRGSRKTILLDRDGILNQKMPPRVYLTQIEDYRPNEALIATLSSKLCDQTDVIIITNQPGVSTGEVSIEFLDGLHSRLIVELLLKGVSVIGLYVCPHHWDANCQCRKPKPGMLNQAILDYKLQRDGLVFIGDEQKDLEAAFAAGVTGVRISDETGEATFKSLQEALPTIMGALRQ